jgi:hypothetical protein
VATLATSRHEQMRHINQRRATWNDRPLSLAETYRVVQEHSRTAVDTAVALIVTGSCRLLACWLARRRLSLDVLRILRDEEAGRALAMFRHRAAGGAPILSGDIDTGTKRTTYGDPLDSDGLAVSAPPVTARRLFAQDIRWADFAPWAEDPDDR